MQTLTQIQHAMAGAGLAPNRQYGQNFLIDLNIHDLIVKTADVKPGDVILEVGPGTGALTSLMAMTGATIVAVEIDPAMAALTADLRPSPRPTQVRRRAPSLR